MRSALALAGVAMLVGCGSTETGRTAQPQVLRLGWHENCGTRANPLPIETHRLAVGERRWRVELSFRNETGVTLFVMRPHAVGETLFGLAPYTKTSFEQVLKRAETGDAKPRTYADRFHPRVPGPLAPGERWSGSFSGLGRLPVATPIRVVLGRFVITQKAPRGFPRGFLCVSKRYARLH